MASAVELKGPVDHYVSRTDWFNDEFLPESENEKSDISI